jgi:hypothetical protein
MTRGGDGRLPWRRRWASTPELEDLAHKARCPSVAALDELLREAPGIVTAMSPVCGDCHRRMGLQPRREGLGGTSLEDGHRPMVFQIHQQRGIDTGTAERELLHAQDTGLGQDEVVRTWPADEGVRADPIAPSVSEPRCRLRIARMGQFQQDPGEALLLASRGSWMLGNGSTKICRGQVGASQKNRRECTTSGTGQRPQDRSQGRRW